MRLEDLQSPGNIPNSQKLRIEALKALNYLTVVSMTINSTSHADTLESFFTACATEAAKFKRVAVTGVTIAGTMSGTVGGTTQFTATVAPAGATDKFLTWTSSDTAIATVDQTGLVTRVAAGTATITATPRDDATKAGTRNVTNA